MLEIKHLTKAYERVILKDVCLSFKEKGLYVITGKVNPFKYDRGSRF